MPPGYGPNSNTAANNIITNAGGATLNILGALSDDRFNPPQRYLRRLYRDPVTNSQQWDLIMAPEGGVMGVRSMSAKEPLKRANFDYLNQSFEGTAKYSDWQFVYIPAVQIQVTAH